MIEHKDESKPLHSEKVSSIYQNYELMTISENTKIFRINGMNLSTVSYDCKISQISEFFILIKANQNTIEHKDESKSLRLLQYIKIMNL